ncbi:Smr/MutS family protein [Jiella sp. MQZ9-1]|uniref:Smr/MutS family protein n=1 Tax=Jiella flava TaxID=2816857 RepID=A0A939JXL3_9HYPH|nr:Smr/MutS family protein [Jiella flava]MBO0663486.1 Smr/MutS family protein [Jiella flava]MCD2472061.1 Smr/MutS family protein [Jiella flava]
MRRRRILSDEDKRLWASVARQAVPLKGKAMPVVPADPRPPAIDGALPPPTAGNKGPLQAQPQVTMGAAGSGNPAKGGALASQHPIERPTRRKIAKGRIAIEARIDLHEMTQTAAYAALSGFLAQAQAMGLRHVLVITGRGMPGGSRGILRRVVPQWFASALFRPLVSGFDRAERHHGGDGALYVRVRRPGGRAP